MADFSFDDFLGSQEPERGNANSSAESGFSFDDFLASDEEPSASGPDVQTGLEQPTAEPTPKKRSITMSPDEMNVPQSTILSKEDAEAKGGMNANEVAARSYEQATGADAPENPILAHLANMGNNLGGRLNANLQMQAAQQLAEGKDRSDDETRGLFSKMMFGATKYLGASLLTNDTLDEWDETFGKSIEDPKERTRARNEFVNELARQFIAERTATKQNATTELENRERGFWANVLGKGPEQIGNMLPYMLGPVGIALHFAEEAGAAGTGYANDEYGFAKDGSLGVAKEGDSAGKAAVKGVASSGIETATELVGGKLASAGAKRVGKWLGPVVARGGKALVGKYPVLSEVGGKIVQSDVGKAVANFGGKMKDAFKLVSKKMHWDGLPEETIEELESDVLSSFLGVGKRDSEYVNADTGEPLGAGGRVWDATKDFFTPKNFIELEEAMLLTMGAGGFMAHMSQRGAQKQVDSFLKSKGIMDAEEVKKADLQTKVAAMDAYTKGLSEEQIREKLDTASGLLDGVNKWLDKGFAKIAGEESDADKVVRLKDFLSEMDSYNALVERAVEIDNAARERGEYTKRFTVQTDANGAPKFQQTIVVSPATGENVTRNQMSDADSGVTVIGTAGHYEVKSDVTGETFRTQSFNRAINAADSMAVLNQQRVAERQQKAQALSGILGGEQYAGRKFEVVETAQQARDAFGGDIENDAPGFTTADGTTVLILDNLDDPKTALAALDKGTPNDRGAFADGVEFATEAGADENGDVTETKIARDKVHGVNIIDAGDGTFVVYNDNGGYATASSLEEAVAVANGAKPKPVQPKAETITQEQANETRTNEAPAQPASEQPTAVGQAEVEAAKPVESAAPSREATDAGVVTSPVSTSEKISPVATEEPAETAEPVKETPKSDASLTTPAQPAENGATSVPKPTEAQTPAEPVKSVEAAPRTSEVGVSKNATTTPAKPDTADLERMIADADPDLESVKASGDAKAFKDALAAKNLPAADANNLLDRFYETHPKAAATARVDAKNILKAKNRGKVTAEAASFAQHLLDKYAPDGQTYKAKREASAAATAEKAKTVPVPGFIADKKPGVTESAVKQVEDYLADKKHNGPSLTVAIDAVKAWAKKNGRNLALLDAFKQRVDAAVESANGRRAKMKDADQWAFGQRNAEIPKDLLDKYLTDHPNTILERLAEEGYVLDRPLPGVGGKLFDSSQEGGEELNHFFDGMKGSERDRWLRIIFGKDTKEGSAVTGNDRIADSLGLSVDEILSGLREAVAAFQAWRDAGAESEEDRHYRELYEEEQAELDKKFGAPTDQFRIDELEARKGADEEYAAAKAFVENKATAKDIAVYSPSALSAAEEGDAIRIDHQKKAYEFSGYDAENGILYVNDFVEVETGDAAGVVREPRRFRVTENGFAEIKEENNGNRRTDETRPADNGASDAQGARNGRGAEEGEGGSSAGSVVRAAENTAGARREEVRKTYNRLKNALDPEWRAAHPDEVAKLEAEGVDVSAVASNPNVSGTDKISWPITATRIGSREDAANIFRLLADPGKEITKVLYLDEDGKILGRRVVAVGLVGATPANIDAVLENVPKDTYGIVFSHNHPAEQGDDIMPSMDDLMLTSVTLKPAVEKAGLKLLDHIITDHNAYLSIGGLRDGHYVSDGAAEFWDKAKALSEFFDESVARPEDRMNIVPFGERINLKEDTVDKLNAFATLASKVHDKSSWAVGIDSKANVVWVASLPKGGDTAAFLAAHPGAMRFAVLNGENAIDMPSFVNAIEQEWKKKTGGDERSRPLVVAVGENGKLTDYEPHGLNDKILNAAKPAAPASGTVRGDSSPRPAPRIANAPKLNDKASKAIDDILGEMGGLLHSPVEPLALSREEERKFRDAVERMVETLADNGYTKFDDLARVVASRRPDIYGRAKDLLRRSWNFLASDPADEITIARGNEIFGIIDNELNRETTNDLGTDAVDAGQRDGAQNNGGERDRTDRGLSVPAGTGDGGAGQGARRPGGGERPAAPVRAGAGGLPVDVREDDGHRGGDGGDAVGQRAVGLGRRDGGHGEVQRDSEGAVPRVGEEVSPGFTAYEPPSDLPVAAPKSQSLIVEPSALASIPQPPITSKPDIPDSIPRDGVLQAHQYEAVCRAVDSQNKTLPDGRRQGYFVGDGMGAGKTRIIAGVMLDAVNRNLGKGKALIISKNKELYDGALGDFEPFGINNRLFDLTDAKWKTRLEKNSKGIAFMTYPSLAQNYAGTDGEGNVRSAGKRGKTLNRYEEIVKWLGKDFDGVIALDEAHSAAKDDGTTAQQAKRSQAVIDLQNALPNARVLYLTATAAYDAKDLRFLTRMGLWGEGTGFRTFSNFADAVNRGGLSMMEVLTQGMKAAGKYCSRSISFKGVNCKRVVANVTPEQKQTYADYSSVLSRIHDAAMSLEGVTGAPRKYLSSQYFGRALDLFNSLITSMKVGKAIELGRQAIAEGKSPVFQLISTNDSAKDAKKAAVPTQKEYDMFGNVVREVPVEDAGEVDANVKDRIVNYLRGGGFPVREYLGMQGGHMQWGEVNPQAVALRDEMIALVNTLPDVGNPIDEIVKAFKDVGISRITGKSNKNAEAAAFNNGDNLALVFSGAGGTGASYHADKRFKNQRQRVQIPIEFGWEPDKFLQALGRSHRNNQVVPPEFVLLTTDIAGEMRFMSTIANRVASMGAIVGGDRNSSGQVVSSSDSVQNKYGSDAINDVKRKLGAGQRIGEMYADEVLDAMFISPDKLDDIKPSQFLGRLQFLPVDEQSAIYGEIASQMERAIAKAKADGTFDDGIRKIDAKRVVVQSRESMSTGENEGQNRDLLTVSEWYDSPRIDHADVEARVPEGQRIEYVRNRRSGKLYALISRSDGAFARLAPNGSYETVQPLERGNYETVIDKDAARKAWDDEYAALPAEVEYVRHYMSGDLVPVWDKIGVEGLIRVYRATPTGGKPFVGLQISEAQLPVTLYSFGKKDEARRFFKENGYRLAAREGANIGIGAKDDIGKQPYFKRAKIGTRYVLAVFQSGANPALEQSLIAGGWQGTWGRDDANSEDRGGQVYYRDFGEDAEAAFNAVIDQYGSVAYRGRNVGFESKDGLARQSAGEAPQRQGISERPASAGTLGGQTPGRYRPDLVQTGAVRGNLRERVGMPEMRMRVQNGELIITNTDSRRKNDLKLAFGGEWANRVRDGKRYVKSGLKWNPDLSGRGGWWSIPLDKVPAGILAEIEGDGALRAPVAPLGSVAEMEREGGLARLSQNPDEFKATFVYNLLRSPVAELDGGKYAKEHESNLIRRAADDGDMSALGELYNRYMKPNADKGGLRGLVRRAAARKGMAGVMNESRIEEVASLVWAGTPVDGGYENNRRGIIADFNNGDTAIYKNAKSLIPVMTAKIDRILNDMAERAANRPEMLTLDAPSRSREDESELDQQIADDSGVAEGLLGGDAANEYVEDADDAAEDVIARKLGDIEGATGGRRLSRAERKRVEAMDMLDETMYFLPEDLQDVINAVLAEERKRGWIDPEREKEKRIAKASFANAQKASGLGQRVFGYRYRTAKDLLNEIWRNIKNDKNDANIAIKASSIDGAQESEEELNDEILQRIDEREPESDMTLAVRLLLRGESVADVADFFEIDPAMVRAWKARARNEHGITFPGEEVNPLGLGDFPERKAVKRGGSAPKAARPRATAWTPDLFAAANATVNDQQNFKIEEGIAANAPDEQIARDAGVDKVIVKLAKIRKGETYQGTLWDEGALRSPVAPLEQGTLGVKTPDVADEIFGYTNAAENSWRSEHGYSEIPKGATVSLDAMHRRGAAMANNIDEMRRMVERLEKSPYAVNETDQIALGVFTAKMKGEYNRLSRLKAEQYANGNEAMAIQTDAEMDELFKWIDRAQRVNKDVGATWGRAGRARQLALDKAGNIADYMISCEKRKGSPLTKEERHQAERLFAELEKADVKLDEATMADIIQHIDAISKARLAAQHDEVKERKAKKQVEQIERDYHEALAQIRFHGEKRSGGVLHGLPNGQKWIRALEAYHLLNGEGLTDGKPDGAKMVDLLVKDINGVGVEATAWDVRQLESRMGNLIKPSQDEISKSLRDLHAQMLVTQQIEHMMKTGEMPPKTGFDRDEDSAVVRALRRERDRTMRQLGIDRKTAEEMLKTALDSYKTRLRNQIEENEKAIADVESGKPYEKRGKRKLDLDDEAQALKAKNDELKKRFDELTRDPAKELESKIVRAMDAVAKTIAVRKEQIAAIQAGTFDFDAKRPKLEDDRLASLRDELKALNAQKDALKKALFPYGTDAEVLHKLELREQAVGRSLDRWNGMAADYTAATSWEDRAKAVAPSVKKNILDAEFASPEIKAAQQRIRDAQKQRDAARRKVLEYRARLGNEKSLSYPVRAWAKFIGSTSVLARAMLDMTVVGVQGARFLRMHPIKAIKIGWQATKAFAKQKWSDKMAEEIASHPYFEDFKKHDGHIYSMDGLEGGEVPEDFRAVEQGAPLPGGRTLTVNMIPGVKRSSRSFAAFLNKAALELYSDMVEAAGPNGAGATDEQKKLIAEFVNTALGYGYGKNKPGVKPGVIRGVLDALAWAPRKAVAEIKFATGWHLLKNLDPRTMSWKEKLAVEREIGRQYLRHILGSLAYQACLLLLAKLINGDDDDDRNRWSDMTDSRSAEFGRVRIGNTRFSVFGGDEMVWRLLARLYTGQTKTNGIVKEKDRDKIVFDYLRSKINPIGGMVWDVSTGENFVGEKLSDKSGLELARNYLLPLTANALYENFAKNPDDPLAAIFNAVPTFYGMTSSTYARDPLDRVAAQGDEAKRRAKAAAEADDAETARRTMSALGERGETYGLVKEVQRLENNIKNLRKKGATDAQLADGLRALAEAREKALKTYRSNREKIKWDDMSWAE